MSKQVALGKFDNVVIDNTLNKNMASRVGKELQGQYKQGLNPFAPLKTKDGKKAPLSKYAELVTQYPELVGKGVCPTYFKLCQEVVEAKKQGATEAQLNARYAMSVVRT